jgi:hypothetical protein
LSVRENDPRERTASQDEKQKVNQSIIDEGIRTGKLYDLVKFTEEVGDFKICAEGQL